MSELFLLALFIIAWWLVKTVAERVDTLNKKFDDLNEKINDTVSLIDDINREMDTISADTYRIEEIWKENTTSGREVALAEETSKKSKNFTKKRYNL